MLAALEHWIIPWLEGLYQTMGYLGILLAMAIESACIPLPSEIVMPMAGWMVSKGIFDLWLVSIAGTLGCTVGSVVAYWVGARGGRSFLLKYGRFVLITSHEIERADEWFRKYGDAAIFLSRLLPVVRTFISLPAGIARMHFGKFVLYTTVGSFPWVLGLTMAGRALGDNWLAVREVLVVLDYPIAAIIALLAAYYVYRHIRASLESRV